MFSLNHYKKTVHSLPLPTLPKLLKTTETQPNKIHYSHPKPTKTSPNFPKRSKPAHQRPNIGPTRPLKWFKHIPKRNLFGWWYFFPSQKPLWTAVWVTKGPNMGPTQTSNAHPKHLETTQFSIFSNVFIFSDFLFFLFFLFFLMFFFFFDFSDFFFLFWFFWFFLIFFDFSDFSWFFWIFLIFWFFPFFFLFLIFFSFFIFYFLIYFYFSYFSDFF